MDNVLDDEIFFGFNLIIYSLKLLFNYCDVKFLFNEVIEYIFIINN